jgi:AcrR family transcriptional regulator
MSTPGLRDVKKAQTRQMISNVATCLFVQRGFENVSVDDIAREAAVSRKTVFNYFPRKEHLFFDREDEVRVLVRDAIAGRGTHSPVHAFEQLMRTLAADGHPLFLMSERPVQFWCTVAESPALTAWARALQVTLADDLASMFAHAIGQPEGDAEASLAAAMLTATLVVAYSAALAAFRAGNAAHTIFATVMERGFTGVDVALAGTAYVDTAAAAP